MGLHAGGEYEYIRIVEADNGFRVTYEIKTKNPMEAESTFGGNRFSYQNKEILFEVTDDVTPEQALDQALALQKKLFMSNLANKSGSAHNSEHKIEQA